MPPARIKNAMAKSAPPPRQPELHPLKQRHDPRSPGVTYQLEHVLCGKAKCRKLHGPYWYAYWKVGKRTRKRYIGKKFRVIDHKLSALEEYAKLRQRPPEPVLGNPAIDAGKRLPKTRRHPAKTGAKQ